MLIFNLHGNHEGSDVERARFLCFQASQVPTRNGSKSENLLVIIISSGARKKTFQSFFELVDRLPGRRILFREETDKEIQYETRLDACFDHSRSHGDHRHGLQEQSKVFRLFFVIFLLICLQQLIEIIWKICKSAHSIF